MPRLDRLVEFDERSRDYPIRTLLAPTTPRSYTWGFPAVNRIPLDQGREGACVGFAWAHEAAARPMVERDVTNVLARSIYKDAQKVDQWDGEDYEGTSVLAGAKIMLERGYITEYRWCFGLHDVVLTVGRKGPVVLGIPWHRDMFRPDPAGFLTPTGPVEGGHAIVCHGVSMRGGYVIVTNSWGDDWGERGRARIRFEHLDQLLHDDGEACVPIRRKSR